MVQNRDTVNAIVDAWKAKPADQRPELILFGESLGSFGSQAAWDASRHPADVTADIEQDRVGRPAGRVDAVEAVAGRPLERSGVAARHRRRHDREGLHQPGRARGRPGHRGKAITFVAHPNDPVVYWSPDLLLQRAGLARPPLGPGRRARR